MACSFAVGGALDRLAPPLQANSAETGLADELGHAGELGVESIERKKIGARPARGERSGDAPVGICLPRDASYGVASLAAHQGRLASTEIKRAPARVPFPWPAAGAALNASRRTPKISCNGEATKIDE